MTPPSSYSSYMNRFSRVGALLVASFGAIVLLTWLFDIALLETVLSRATMKVNAACGFLAAGVALWALHTSSPASRSLARVLSVTVAALGGLTLAEDLFAIDFGIDQFILQDAPQAAHTLHPGRMAPATALTFLLIGLALLTIKTRYSALSARAHWLALPPLFVSTVAIVGYAYDVRSLYKVGPYTSMAAHTALSFFVLTLALLAANPARGIANIVISDTAGGVVARRLLTTIPFILFGIGWALRAGEDAGFYNTDFGFALMVVLGITVSALAVASTAVKLRTVDIHWKNAKAEIMNLNAGLERRVQERTEELENALAQVKQLRGLLPFCAWCKKIRDDQDYWHSVEQYVSDRTDARFSHSICPDCEVKFIAQGQNLRKI